jgi:hypothetical protein
VRAGRQAVQGDLLEDDPLVARLIKLVRKHKNLWKGTATDLLRDIQDTSGPSWGPNGGPHNARGMRAALDRVAEALAQAHGWQITVGREGRGNDRQRTIELRAPSSSLRPLRPDDNLDVPF